MKTLATLLWKDLRRAWRNPIGWLVNLAVPLVITALIGAIFGPRSETNALGRIRFAVVDEDNSVLSRFLRGGMNQDQGGKYLEPVFLGREEALRQIQQDKLSAMLVIPAGFTHTFLVSTNVARLELVKNPAQSIHPAVLEELLGVVVTALDSLKRNFGSELPDWYAVFHGQGDYHRISELIVRAGDKLEGARKLLAPPRVSYTREDTRPEQTTAAVAEKGPVAEESAAASKAETRPSQPAAPKFNIFGYLLLGMAAMFLLFLAENASRDIQRELQQRTLQRFRTLRTQLYLFVAGKVLFILVFTWVAAGIILGGGGLLFQVRWHHVSGLAGLTLAYCVFAAGLMTLIPAVLGDHQSAQALGNIIAMVMSLVGGNMFPARQLPGFLRDHVTSLMPTYWYAEAARSLSFDAGGGPWLGAAMKLLLAGVVLMALASVLLRRNLEKGPRP